MGPRHTEGDAVLDAAIPQSEPDPLRDGPHIAAAKSTLLQLLEACCLRSIFLVSTGDDQVHATAANPHTAIQGST